GLRSRRPLGAHVEQVDEKVVGKATRSFRKNAMARVVPIRFEYAHTADENSHLGCRQRKQLSFVHQHLFGIDGVALFLVVAETVSGRLQVREGIDLSLLVRGVGSAGRKWHRDRMPGILSGLFNGRTSTEHDHIRYGNSFVAGLAVVESLADLFKGIEHLT